MQGALLGYDGRPSPVGFADILSLRERRIPGS
jgi:hypothetical protein